MHRDKRDILIVVEGGKQEPKLVESLIKQYDLDSEYQVYSYGTNVYELYERMFEGGASEDLEALSLLGVLKERESDDEKRALLDRNYSDVLLIFDFDCHDNRFSKERLRRLSDYFSESTDEGKLYINYPMVEACKHFKGIPDDEYLSRFVRVGDVHSYKADSNGEWKYQNFELDFDREVFDGIISMTLEKALWTYGVDARRLAFREACEAVDFDRVLNAQLKAMEEQGLIYVLGTCVLFIADYSPCLIDWKGWSLIGLE